MILAIPSIGLYCIASLLLGVNLVRGGSAKPGARPWALGMGLAAAAIHALILFQLILTGDGLNLGFFNAISLVAWVIATILLLAAFVAPTENLGIPLLPLAALTLGLAIGIPSDRIISNDAPWELRAHIALSVISYSLLALAAAQSILLAIQDRHLHARRPGGFIRALPPLRTMEEILFQLMALGFITLSMALISGIFFLDDIFAQQLAHKTLFSVLGWLVFATLLWGRWRHGWRGKKAIRWTLGGFIFLLLGYFGSKLVLELILS